MGLAKRSIKSSKPKEKFLPKRHIKKSRYDNAIDGITSPVIKRMARRAGVKRLSNKVYPSTRNSMLLFLTSTIHDAIVCAQHSKRTTLSEHDVNFAFRRQGRGIYS